jgi:hypothetical protein
MKTALALMQQVVASGQPIDRPDLVAGIDEITELMDYGGMREREAQLLKL